MASIAFNWEPYLEYASVSDIGMRRVKNQDSHREVLAASMDAWRRQGHLFVVADGMGAHAAGELASRQAVEGISHLYSKYEALSPPEALLRAVRETNGEIYRRGQANAEFFNMGTTCSVLLLLPQGALVAHVGDSRVYRRREDQLQQLTFDHSLAWEVQAAGLVRGADPSSSSIPKNVITRSLGPHPQVQVDLEGPFSTRQHDVFLLCSDGLTGKVDDREIGAILGGLPPGEAAQMLIDLANLRGGPDNITATVVKLVATQLTSGHAAAAPFVVGARPQHRRVVHPLVWVGLAVGFLASLLLVLVEQPGVALAALALGIAALAVALLQKFGPDMGITLRGGRRLGKGPYRRTACPLDATFFTGLGQTLVRVQEALSPDTGVPPELAEWVPREGALGAGDPDDPPAALAKCAAAARRLVALQRDQHSRVDRDASRELG
jgi:protein phosphatase